MRKEYEITTEELNTLLDACKPVPYMIVGNSPPRSPQENADTAWASLGRTHGFKWNTAEPVSGKSQQFFTAEQTEVKP